MLTFAPLLEMVDRWWKDGKVKSKMTQGFNHVYANAGFTHKPSRSFYINEIIDENEAVQNKLVHMQGKLK